MLNEERFFFPFYYKILELLSKVKIRAVGTLGCLCRQSLEVVWLEVGRWGLHTHFISSPLEAAYVACTLVLLGLHVHLGLILGVVETWGPSLTYSSAFTLG